VRFAEVLITPQIDGTRNCKTAEWSTEGAELRAASMLVEYAKLRKAAAAAAQATSCVKRISRR
jgi:hypothetical protein